MLPIQRNSWSGANVPCWKTEGVPVALAGVLRSSYQRMPATVLVSTTALTVWLTTSDSWSPKLR